MTETPTTLPVVGLLQDLDRWLLALRNMTVEASRVLTSIGAGTPVSRTDRIVAKDVAERLSDHVTSVDGVRAALRAIAADLAQSEGGE